MQSKCSYWRHSKEESKTCDRKKRDRTLFSRRFHSHLNKYVRNGTDSFKVFSPTQTSDKNVHTKTY